MFQRKLTLTANTCTLLENVRFALETWVKHPIRFKELELNRDLLSGHGRVYVGSEDADPDDLDNEMARSHKFAFVSDEDRTFIWFKRLGPVSFSATILESPRRAEVRFCGGSGE